MAVEYSSVVSWTIFIKIEYKDVTYLSNTHSKFEITYNTKIHSNSEIDIMKVFQLAQNIEYELIDDLYEKCRADLLKEHCNATEINVSIINMILTLLDDDQPYLFLPINKDVDDPSLLSKEELESKLVIYDVKKNWLISTSVNFTVMEIISRNYLNVSKSLSKTSVYPFNRKIRVPNTFSVDDVEILSQVPSRLQINNVIDSVIEQTKKDHPGATNISVQITNCYPIKGGEIKLIT